MNEKKRTIFLGSLYNKGQSFAGATWDANGLSPTLTTMQGGGQRANDNRNSEDRQW